MQSSCMSSANTMQRRIKTEWTLRTWQNVKCQLKGHIYIVYKRPERARGALAFSVSPQLKCSQPFVYAGAINKFGLQMMAVERAVPRPPQHRQRNKDSARRWRWAILLQPPPPCEDIPLCGIGPRALLEFGMDRLKSYINFIAFTVWVGFGPKAGWMDERGRQRFLFRFFILFYFSPDERNLYNEILCLVRWLQFSNTFIGQICWRCPMHGASRKRLQAELFPERCNIAGY